MAKSPKQADPVKAMGTILAALEALASGDQQWVLQSVATKLNLSVPAGTGGGVAGTGGGTVANASNSGSQTPIKQTDAKTFMKGKNPQSDIQRVACLAYYLNHARDIAAFKTANITKLNTEARGPDFNTTRAIDNASRATCGYLSPIGKGQKQLSAFGEEIVEALPAQDAVKTLEVNRKSSKRGGKGKKGKKKSKTG